MTNHNGKRGRAQPDPKESARRNLRERIARLKDPSPWQIAMMIHARQCLDVDDCRLGEEVMSRAERPDLYEPR